MAHRIHGADQLLQQAQDPETTPFDYVIVGSGAGGGPLAARLALEGRRVLLLEAGRDAAVDQDGRLREVYQVPAYNAAATEDPAMSWAFSVRHYEDVAQQRLDRKYRQQHDPSANGQPGRGGILYPRCSALGGCTAHHAMVMIRPNDADWDRIAAMTGDPSWGSANMQGYFPRIERNLYYRVYGRFLGRILGGAVGLVRRVMLLVDPQGQLDTGGHGWRGWQPTSFIDPVVVARIARRDRTFRDVLTDAALAVISGKAVRNAVVRAMLRLRVVQALDPNVRSPRFPERPRLSLLPIGVDGSARSGVREHLLHVQRQHPDRLVIATESFVTRVIFAAAEAPAPPRAIGVRVQQGARLYAASTPPREAPDEGRRCSYFARQEVILCGGAFNTPQLLMLSGIGDAGHLAAMGITHLRGMADDELVAPVVHLPAVGANLQDRYEVSVLAEADSDFSSLEKVSFRPGDLQDPARADWLEGLPGLYSTNGGALVVMERSSEVDAREPPNLFMIGVPAAFRGYYWGWPDGLLRRTWDAPNMQRNLWSWVILQAYTRNNLGQVRLLSADPFATPEIVFRSFHPDDPQARADLTALHDAVVRARQINACIRRIKAEVDPGPEVNTREEIEDWIKAQAWGHHACGTCRMGPDPWRAHPDQLQQRNAVVDSAFRVHGVTGLRVVDASIFPDIPGYFIVTPTFMVAEKAADTLLARVAEYPPEFEQREARAIHERRVACGAPPGPAPGELPGDTVGLALSGGGIRSATFGLGVLQALARRGALARIDLMSCVSGGGYIGAFLGRLFTRHESVGARAFDRVREALLKPSTPELRWLRQYANYLRGGGSTDLVSTLGHVARNLSSVHFLIGVLALGLFAALRFAADRWLGAGTPLVANRIPVSPWWWVPLALLFLLTVPYVLAYWLSPAPRARESPLPILVWIALAAVAIAAIGIEPISSWAGLMTLGVVFAWFLQGVARWHVKREESVDMGLAGPSVRVRNRLNRGVGLSIVITLAAALFVLLDTAARIVATQALDIATWGMLASAVGLGFLRTAAMALAQFSAPGPNLSLAQRALGRAVAALAFGLAALLLLFLDVVAHAAFERDARVGAWVAVSCIAVSLVLARGLRFLNLSSLHAFYTEKLVRTFLGASNDARVRPKGSDPPVRIDVPDARDDIWLHKYHPERAGGPLHLVNACLNSTVDAVSGRQLPQDRGLPMCLGPAGISVGRRFHAVWGPPSARGLWPRVEPLPASTDPNAFHVLARSDDDAVRVEPLRLGQWAAISGAAFSTGAGRETRLTRSLLFGLLNIRLGYWWDSGIPAWKRPSRYPPGLWRRIVSLPALLFRAQSVLLSEWRGSFPGPSARHWYLSDGGHFDNSGLYELLRRRVPFIVAVVAGHSNQAGAASDFAVLTRAARVDFGATFSWDPPVQQLPGWIANMLDVQGIGTLAQLQDPASPRCAALCHVTYAEARARKESWLLVIRPKLAPALPADVTAYAAGHPEFPYEPLIDQFFDDAQWESYRMLGLMQGEVVFRRPNA